MCAPDSGRPRRVAPTNDPIILLNCIILFPYNHLVFDSLCIRAKDEGQMNIHTLSRRQLLIGLSAAATGTMLCATGGAASLVLLIANQRPTPTTIPTLAPQPTGTLTPPPIIARADWGALAPDHTAANELGFYSLTNPEGWRVYDTPLEQTYQTIVIHHSVIYGGDDDRTVREVQRTHQQERGWADVGYHFLIGKNGSIYEGRQLEVRGTHVEGYNTGSLGVCFLGNFQVDAVNDAQFEAAQRLLRWLVARLQITYIAGHRDFNPQTECPGSNLDSYVTALAEAFNLIKSADGYRPPADATETSFLPCACCGCSSIA